MDEGIQLADIVAKIREQDSHWPEVEEHLKLWEKYGHDSQMFYARYCELAAGTPAFFDASNSKPTLVRPEEINALNKLFEENIRRVIKNSPEKAIFNAMYAAAQHLPKQHLLELSNFVENYLEHESLEKIGFCIFNNCNIPCMGFDLLEYFKKHGIEKLETVKDFYKITQTPHKVGELFKILDMYFDNAETVFKKMYKVKDEMLIGSMDVSELLSQRAYNEIKKDDNAIERILKSKYSSIATSIKDLEVRSNASYADLDLLNDTYNLIREIHIQRKSDDWNSITNSFLKELDRSIGQGGDLRSKIRYLRRYCNEVQKQMKENAEELMVMHYGH